LSHLDIYCDGLVSIISLDVEHYISDTEGFVELASSIRGVAIAVFICEMKKNVYKVSIRSRCRIDVSDIARRMDGGGHLKAAGFRFEGDEKVLKKHLLYEIAVEIENHQLLPGEPLLEMPPEDGFVYPDWI